MIRLYIIWIGVLLLGMAEVKANNIKVDSLKWSANFGEGQEILTMTFTVSWDNSWRDDFNYDAAYIFFKFKVKEKNDSPTEEWHHLYLMNSGNQILGSNAAYYSYWLSPLSVADKDYNTGLYIFRNSNGGGTNKIKMQVSWNIKQQLGPQLTANQIRYEQLLVSAHALEMVYVPRGAFRIGDGVSAKTFKRNWFPISKEYDLVSNNYEVTASENSDKAHLASDHINDNNESLASVWSGGVNSWWMIDFGEGNEKAVSWFGVNAYKYGNSGIPIEFELRGGDDPQGGIWEPLWTGSGDGNWVKADDAYPVQKAIKIQSPRKYRCYILQVNGMKSGIPMITSIAMSDKDLVNVVDRTVLIDGPTTPKDSVRYLGASDGSVWAGTTIPATFPNGYKGFYAMKYELSQDQYVRFLNKLTYKQQNTILEGRLDNLKEGDYVFGDPAEPSSRNGILVVTKMEGKPVVFSTNLPLEGGRGNSLNIACNYMCIADMLAYADWAGLRPLTEMEYEKMSRPGYPYQPVWGEYAWNSDQIEQASDLGSTAGTAKERPVKGNANYGNEPLLKGPIRCGAFATVVDGRVDRRHSGAGFSGVMELSGNLSEMYYNANNTNGMVLVKETMNGSSHTTAHGDGYLDVNGRYDGFKNTSKQWQANQAYIALRGGSFADEATFLAVSDRSRHANALSTIYQRDSTVTFRLGRSVPEQKQIVSVLTLENGKNTLKGEATDMLDNTMQSYTIRGNKPEGIEGAYTYIWYMKEEKGQWRVLEGENDANYVLKGFASDTRISQYYYLKRKVITPFTDSDSSSVYQVVLSRKAIVNNGSFRSWADGTYARSAMEYRYPTLPYKYEGAVGSGVYRIDPDGPAGPIEPFDVYCDMETSGGGWMLAGKFSNDDEKRWIASKEIWMDDTDFGDATDIRKFEDAKSAVWHLYQADTLMFKTMRVPDKAFKTTKRLSKRTLSAYFKLALANCPNKSSYTCYETFPIVFLNGASPGDFKWIGGNGFETDHTITIAKSDPGNDKSGDSMGVISGFRCGYDLPNDDADWGLGSSNTPMFGVGENESDVSRGGDGAAEAYNVLLFIK